VSDFLCLPKAWLKFFEDMRLVAVLTAHAQAPRTPDGFIDLSERECVALTYLDRETVRKKKHELIERYGVLVPAPGSGQRGKPLLCRLDTAKLHSFVKWTENPPPVDGKPPSEWTENQPLLDGKPPSEWTENQPLLDGKPPSEWTENPPLVDGKPPTSGDASLALKKASYKTASCDEQPPQPKPNPNPSLEQELADEFRYTVAKSGYELQPDEPTVRNATRELARIAGDRGQVKRVLDKVESTLRAWVKHPETAKTFGYIVMSMRGAVDDLQRMPPGRAESTDTRQYTSQFAQVKSL
jgi:hypothetical protein